LRDLIVRAYSIDYLAERHLLVGGPDNILSARFDVSAKPPEDRNVGRPEVVPIAQAMLMLRSLLADRFKLRTHTETREIPIFALMLTRDGRLGPQLQRSRYNCREYQAARRSKTAGDEPLDSKNMSLCFAKSFQTDGLTVKGAGEIADLIRNFQGLSPVDRPVVDMTGLSGNFEWLLTFAPPWMKNSQLTSIYTALPEQLGLKLEPQRAPIQVRVIDSVSMPEPD